MTIEKVYLPAVFILLFSWNAVSQNYSNIVYPDNSGKLVYEKDERGSHIPDYSVAGYMGGGVPIPDVPVVKTVKPGKGDDTQRIQDAINWVANNVSPGPDNFRGAVLLKAGVYQISSTIHFREQQSGIVLRGEGAYGNGTVIIHKGTEPETSIQISGGSRHLDKATDISDPFVPVGAKTFKVDFTSGLHVGQKIVVKCNHTQKWINALQQEDDWSYWQFWVDWERIITAIDTTNNEITINGPITTQIDEGNGYATGEVHKITSDTRTAFVGIEDLIIMSDYDRSVKDKDGYYVDENHARIGIQLHSGHDCWVRRVTGFFHYWSLVRVRGPFYRATIEDCAMIDGVSTDTPNSHTGTRDYYFLLGGNQILCQRSYGRYGRHTFLMAGPESSNVFLDCYSEKEHLSCEPHQRWTHGALYDNVYNDAIFKLNRPGGGHGWRAANCMFWNITCENYRSWEADIHLDKPLMDLGKQWAIGIINNGDGKGIANPFSNLGDTAYVESVGTFVDPRSLYLAQLKDRLGDSVVAEIATANQYASRRATWDHMLDQYQHIPEFGDPKELEWLPTGKSLCNAPNPPAIDGVMEEAWKNVQSYPIEKKSIGSQFSDTDLSAKIRAKWDQNNLYMLVEVKDSILINDSGNQPLEDDAVAIFIDGNNDRAKHFGNKDHQYIFRWNDPTAYDYQHSQITTNPPGVMFAQDTTSEGYIMEIQMAWNAMGISKDNISLIGVDVHVIDDDTGDGHDKKIAWITSSKTLSTHQSTFGTVLLKNHICGASKIIANPEDTSVNFNSNALFSIQALYADQYQWQINEGSGFVDLADNITYSGVQTNTLHIKEAPSSISGYKYRCYVSNESGRDTSYFATLKVTDLEAPSIDSIPEDQLLGIRDSCHIAIPDYTGDVNASDNIDEELEITQAPAPGTLISRKNIEVIITVEDQSGNAAQKTFNVQLVDQDPPEISSTHHDQVLEPGSDNQATLPDFTAMLQATDNCYRSSELTITQTPAPYTAVTDTAMKVTLTVSDPEGNSSQVDFFVVAGDEIDPTIQCKDDQLRTLNQGETTYTASGREFAPVSVDDNFAIAQITNDYNNASTLDGAEFTVDTTTITWTVTDRGGNKAECSFDIMVDAYTGINLPGNSGIHLYPNPTSGIIHYTKPTRIRKIMLSDPTGKTRIELSDGQIDGTIDISKLNSGIFFMQMTTAEGIWTTKIIKE